MTPELTRGITQYWNIIQGVLFPFMKEEVGPCLDSHYKVIATLEVIRIEEFVKGQYQFAVGRPMEDRKTLARVYVAKSVLNIPTTVQLIDRLKVDHVLRRICGFERVKDIPSESTFSRAFAEFAASDLPALCHEALVTATLKNELIGHISRDSTEIEAREKPVKKVNTPTDEGKKRGRPSKGEVIIAKPPTRLERQGTMSLEEMLADLPKACDVGAKRNSKGFKESWAGFKLHLDTADGQIPISGILTSASVHDSQVAIPLATMTNGRVTNCYDLMDAAYDAPLIKEHSISLGHVPIIDTNPRTSQRKQELLEEEERLRLLNFRLPEQVRYNNRSSAERVNARLKDEFGGRFVRVRGHAKVYCHLMFGILALTADQIMRLAL